jgi:peptide/nickel transport system substrate-binding protein
MTAPNTSSSLSRRAVLAGAAVSTVSTAGCVGQLQNIGNESAQSQLSLDIKALPADSDPFGIQIAQQLRSNLEAVGVDVRLSLVSTAQFTQQVLLNHDFDIYVGQAPFALPPDPDALYPLFHSGYTTETGWQNPFGFTNQTCDDLLVAQRSHTGGKRQQDVRALQKELARYQPISPVVFPDLLTGVRTDRFTGWDPDERDPALGGPTRPHNLLLLEGDTEQSTLRLATANDRLTSNRNPISAAYQGEQSLLDLVYDSVALKQGSEYIPWLAREISWAEGTATPEVEIELRDELLWHEYNDDNKQLTAFDVGFTYEFLQDTSLGAASKPIPSERFHGVVSVIDDVTVENSRRLRLTFTDTTQAVAQRALTVPILREDIWEPRTQIGRQSSRAGPTTDALTTNNSAAIGSGPLRFESADNSVVEFSLFDEHFLWPSGTTQDGSGETNETQSEDGWLFPFFGGDGDSNESPTNSTTNSTASQTDSQLTAATDLAPPPEPYSGVPPFDTITLESMSATGVVGLLQSGNVDATLGPVGPQIASIADNSSNIELVESQSNAFYHLGFNTRREPLRSPNVRQLIAQLLDKPTLVEESFGGYGSPAASPLAETDWVANSLQWDEDTDTDPVVPFLGTDGELSVEDARDRFRSLDYEYNSDKELISKP